MRYQPLSREEVRKAVRREHPSRIPLVRATWWGEGLREQYGSKLDRFSAYPSDVAQVFVDYCVDVKAMDLSWELKDNKAYDNNAVLESWDRFEEFAAKLPKPESYAKLDAVITNLKKAREEGRYIQLSWWNLFFEQDWVLRGMEDLMIDFYINPQMIHRLHALLADYYCSIIAYVDDRVKLDGFFASDDLGHQSGPMFSPEVFHELFYPYYCQVGTLCSERDIDFWLHSCGDVTLLLEDLIDAGVNVIHPIQKHTMDEKTIAKEYGHRITFLAGIDVQHSLQEKDPQGVRQEVRFLIDTFDRPEGGMCIGAGNGIVGGTPLENIEAFLEEAYEYGLSHRRHYS